MIREWQPRDNSAVAKIERESFSDPWTEDMLGQSLSSPAFKGFVDEDGCIRGYVGVICAGDAEIALIAVDARFRRQGLGKGLLLHAAEHARSNACENLFLEVRTGNLPARALYEGLGFKPIAVRPRYYADGEDALVMVLPL